MRKNYAYLLFALFFAFSSCKEENVEDSLTQEVIAQEPTLFTFIYKGKEYEELRSNPDDPLQSKVIEKVLLTDNYSISPVSDRKNTYLLFDNSDHAKRYFSELNANSRCLQPSPTQNGGNWAILVLFRDKNLNGITSSIGPTNSGYSAGAQLVLIIDNQINPDYTGINRPSSINIPSLGVSPYDFNDRTSSLYFQHSDSYYNKKNNCTRPAIVFLYQDQNYGGVSILFSVLGDVTARIPDLTDYLFYDFFGVKYGPSWNDKASSMSVFFGSEL